MFEISRIEGLLTFTFWFFFLDILASECLPLLITSLWVLYVSTDKDYLSDRWSSERFLEHLLKWIIISPLNFFAESEIKEKGLKHEKYFVKNEMRQQKNISFNFKVFFKYMYIKMIKKIIMTYKDYYVQRLMLKLNPQQWFRADQINAQDYYV